MECSKISFADMSNQTFVHDTYMKIIDEQLQKYYEFPYNVPVDVLKAIRFLLDNDVESEHIIDYLYEKNIQYMCDDLGLGLPCQYVGQSAPLGVIGEEPTPLSKEVQVTGFMDEPTLNFLDLSAPSDVTRQQEDYAGTSSIANFLSRPRIIHEFRWAIGTDVNIDLEPWSLFMIGSNAIIDKVNNFNIFRAKALRIQIRTNGSPFHYGRLRASYYPGYNIPVVGANMDDPHDLGLATTNFAGGFNTASRPLYTFYSQAPGVYVDPTTNVPQQMDLPFFNNLNYLNVLYDEAFEDMGKLKIWSLNQLQHANGATDPITVSIIAYMIDPVLGMPTQNLAYIGQSQTGGAATGVNDEYGKGIISRPASALASFAGSLSRVPTIGRFARATQIGASAVSSIATLFGFSKPVNLAIQHQTHVTSDLTNVSGEDSVVKLSLDPKAEISVDPQIVGLPNVDEMSFGHIGSHESFLVSIPWTEAEAAGTNLCNIVVHPSVSPWSGSGSTTTFFPTAVSWMSQPFEYWRGSLEYRIMIVASQMHRGRLLITYNPSDRAAQSTTSPDLATQYSQIVNLAEHRDVTYVVRWGSADPYRQIFLPTTTTNLISSGAAVPTNGTKLNSNGVLSFYVLNELASPTNTSSIRINVFVKAGDDYMVGGPNNSIEEFCYFTPTMDAAYGGAAAGFADTLITVPDPEVLEGQSLSSTGIDYKGSMESMSNQPMRVVINGSAGDPPDVDELAKVFFGEWIVSLRSLLKRYTLLRSFGDNFGTTTSNLTQLEYSHANFPPGPGLNYYDSTTINTNIAGPTAFNFMHNTYMHYFRQAFAAYRGSVRYKYLGNVNAAVNPIITATRDTRELPTADRFAYVLTGNFLGGSFSSRSRTFMLEDREHIHSAAGMGLKSVFFNNGVDIELPWYAPVRFLWTFMPYQTSPTSFRYLTETTLARNHHKVCIRAPSGAFGTAFSFSQFVAAGEDFSLHYFLGAPVYGFVGQPAAV